MNSNASQELSRVLEVEDMAQFFKTSTETIMRRCRNRELPAFKFGKKWLAYEKDLVAYLADKVQSYRHLRRSQEDQP